MKEGLNKQGLYFKEQGKKALRDKSVNPGAYITCHSVRGRDVELLSGSDTCLSIPISSVKASKASGHTALRGKCPSVVLSEEMFRM